MKKRLVALALALVLMLTCSVASASDIAYLEKLNGFYVGEQEELTLKPEISKIMTEEQKQTVHDVMRYVAATAELYLMMPFFAGGMDESNDVWDVVKDGVKELEVDKEYKDGITIEDKQIVDELKKMTIYFSNAMMKSQTWKAATNKEAYLKGWMDYLETYFMVREVSASDVNYWPDYKRDADGELILNEAAMRLFTSSQQEWMKTLITSVADFMAEAHATSYADAMKNNPTYLAIQGDIVLTKLTKTNSFTPGLSMEEKETAVEMINIVMNLSMWSMDAEWWQEPEKVANAMSVLESYLNACCESNY